MAKDPAPSGLVVAHLRVEYPSRPPVIAVDDASFTVARRASLAIVGPSGSGKSTLLAAIAGIAPARGSIRWEGAELLHTPTHLRGVGLVFQDGQLFPHLTVEGNIEYGLRVRGVQRAQRHARVAELLELVGLPGMQDRRVTELSGGERQRVALARTLAPSPELVLLDEPLSALDADLRGRLATDLRTALEAEHATWLIVTHDAREADALADQTARMDAGRLSM